MYSFERLKTALEKREKERFEALRKEIQQMKDFFEKILTMFFESTASQARTNYPGLEMF